MNEMSINELNSIIKELNFDGLIYIAPITRQINSIPIVGSVEHCGLEARNEIRRRFINNEYKNENISEELYYYIIEFLLANDIAEEEKNIVSKYLNEDLKNIIFDKFVEKILKLKFKFDSSSIDNSIWYNPKKNGVPLKNYYISKSTNQLVNSKLEISFESFKEFIKNFSKKETLDLICIKHLINESGVLEKEWCPKKIKMLMEKLNTEEWDNFEEQMCDNSDKLMEEDLKQKLNEHETHVNEKLKKEILSTIPESFDDLEKIIYVYYKLCELFTYDSVYYIDSSSKKNEPVTEIDKYNAINNNIVCYEFSYIFSDIIHDMGVKYIAEKKLRNGHFDNGHANIKFIYDDLVLFADSTTTVQGGDLSISKFSIELNGIRCEQYNIEKQQRFKKAKEKVKSYIEKEKLELDSMLPNKEEIDKLSVNDKIVILNNYLVNCNLKNCDFVAYAYRLISLLKLNMETRLFYDNESFSRFLLQFNLPFSYTETEINSFSYMIDSTTKKIYDVPSNEYSFSEIITFRQKNRM